MTPPFQGASTLNVRRVYFTLHHVLKELSSKRLAADQRAFAEVSAVRSARAATRLHAALSPRPPAMP